MDQVHRNLKLAVLIHVPLMEVGANLVIGMNVQQAVVGVHMAEQGLVIVRHLNMADKNAQQMAQVHLSLKHAILIHVPLMEVGANLVSGMNVQQAVVEVHMVELGRAIVRHLNMEAKNALLMGQRLPNLKHVILIHAQFMEDGDNGVIGTPVQSAAAEVPMEKPDPVTAQHHNMADQNVLLMAQVLLNLKLVTQMSVPSPGAPAINSFARMMTKSAYQDQINATISMIAVTTKTNRDARKTVP